MLRRWRDAGTSGKLELVRPLVFVHIPKTAGTSFTGYVTGHIPKRQITPTFLGDYNSIELNGGPRFLSGHFFYREIAPRIGEADYITFLRDPVTRSLSQYKSWNDPINFRLFDPWRRRASSEVVKALKLAQRLTYDEFVLSGHPMFEDQLADLQTRMLSGHADRSPELLASAKETLNKMTFVGITEAFPESIASLRRVFVGLDNYAVPRSSENRSRPRDTHLSDAGKARLAQLIQNDVELYRYGVQLFARRAASEPRVA